MRPAPACAGGSPPYSARLRGYPHRREVRRTSRTRECGLRRGGRVVEGARLESVYAGNRIAGSNPAPSASYYVLDIAYIIVFLGSLFSREFAGVTGLVFKAIRGRDGCTRDFGRGRYENLSGAISWLTFLAGGAADVRRSRSDWRRELAESTICSQRKPRSFRCSAQPAGSRGVRRINVWAVSCGGFRPLMMAVVMSGASQGRRRRE